MPEDVRKETKVCFSQFWRDIQVLYHYNWSSIIKFENPLLSVNDQNEKLF